MSSSLPLRSLFAVALLLAPAVAKSEVIGLVAPQSGPYASLGQQMVNGAAFAAVQGDTELKLINESCEPGSGPAIAEHLIEAKVDAAIGFLCSESLDGSLPQLKQAGIPAISISVRWMILMEDAQKHGWPFFRMAPTSNSESAKLVDVILENWPGAAWALVEDGTIHGRELSEAIRNRLEERGMKPVFIDTYRPGQEQQVALVRRLKKTGATHVFVGGDRNDVATIARDAASENIPLVLLAGEAMLAADQPVPLADGVYAVTLPDYPSLPEAADASETLRKSGIEPEGYLLPTFAAVTMIEDAAKAARAEQKTLVEALTDRPFETVIGPVSFGADHELRDNPYRLLQWRDGRFVPPAAPSQ